VVAEVAVDPKIAEVRAQLPVTAKAIYCNTGWFGPLPTVVTETLKSAAGEECDDGRVQPGSWEVARERLARIRALFGELAGADSHEIALTHSSTEGINVVLAGLRWSPGDEIVTTNLEHPGLSVPLALIANRYGVVVRVADLGHGGDDVVAQLEAKMTSRTRLLALSHVFWSSGAIVPLGEVADLAHRHGALCLIDAAQGAGQVPVDLHASGVDAYAMSGQKWLCGPAGTGALFVRRDRLAEISPTYIRYGQIDGTGYLMPAPGAARYELGEFLAPALRAQEAGLRWLRDEVGFDWIHARIREVGQRCAVGLAGIDGVTVTSPRHRMAGLVCFTVEGVGPQEVAAWLFERGINIRYVVYPPNPEVARVSCGWWNTDEEIDAIVAAVAEIARAARAGDAVSEGA
jgi:L-cysteine/cystine lyase